jgi:hypothetical protein
MLVARVCGYFVGVKNEVVVIEWVVVEVPETAVVTGVGGDVMVVA